MPAARLNPTAARAKLQAFRFADLFIEDLGWNLPASRKTIPLEHEGVKWSAQEIAQLSGFRVFEITALDPATPPRMRARSLPCTSASRCTAWRTSSSSSMPRAPAPCGCG